MKIIIKLVVLIGLIAIYFFLKGKKENSKHLSKPLNAKEEPLSDEFLEKLMNSPYSKNLVPLKELVKGHKVINAIVGNAGFVLILDNNCWASAFRIEDTISFEYGIGNILEENMNKINSEKFGDATEPISIDKPYANEKNDKELEVRKSFGKIIEGLAIGERTFNFAFENDMELDFQLCNDKNNKPSIRIYWEQW